MTTTKLQNVADAMNARLAAAGRSERWLLDDDSESNSVNTWWLGDCGGVTDAATMRERTDELTNPTTEIRVNDGLGRVWEARPGHWRWAHPDGSEGEADTFAEAVAALEAVGEPTAQQPWQYGAPPRRFGSAICWASVENHGKPQ